jgi:glutathione S-transferase
MERMTLEGIAAGSPWLTGDQFTAADVFFGSNLHWGMMAELFPKDGPIAEYIGKCAARPALKRALQIEEVFIKQG